MANPTPPKGRKRGKSATTAANKIKPKKRRTSSPLKTVDLADKKADVVAEKKPARPVQLSNVTKRRKSAERSAKKLKSKKRRTSSRLRKLDRAEEISDAVAETTPVGPVSMADPTPSKGRKRGKSAKPDANQFKHKKGRVSTCLKMIEPADPLTNYEAMSVFQTPLYLVENGPGGKLKLCHEVIDELKQIRCPLNVIAITGPYRSGKSYLLNYLAGERKGFPLGSSIRGQTKGIWVWCRPHPERKDEILLLLDTEGLGDIMEGDEEIDNWIFVLSVLLSSTLVYNCKSVIGQEEMSNIHYVTELTERIKTREMSENEDGREFFKFFPNFVWVVRDFTLDLKYKGTQITANEYLALALQLKEGRTRKIDEHNRPRQCIRQFFGDKTCFVFPIPVLDCKKMKKLERLPHCQLQPMFVDEAEKFCRYIYTRSFPKTAEGQPITGKSLNKL